MQRGREKAEGESTEGASTSSSISLEAREVGGGPYDVFLSFKGSDTRKEFTDHLYHSLVKGGTVPFYVFKDDESISIGKEFGSQLFSAISQSKISIPIISENYAQSKWCLRELVHMMDCKNSMSHIVLPIFYKVKPSDLRYPKGSFADAFHLSQKHFDDKDIQEGRRALNEVSFLHGWESEKVANGHEGELVKRVVKTIISKLQEDFQLDVPKQLVGLGGRVKEIVNWIDNPSINARMIGIYGMGGIGKTTLAKCIYNKLSSNFEHVSFLPDVRETIRRHGITYLQSQLISDLQQSESHVSRIDDGINIIKSRFRGKKVLILLDDIDDKNQLDALAREHSWFMAGSMIIVTTRNKAILDQSEFEVDYKYELTELDKVHALLLFNKHAFRMDHSPRDFEGISRDIISTMGGLPLALQVVGSYLHKKTNRKVWEDVWKQLKSQPHRDVQKILQISYDALENGQKQIFIDIVCFFIGETSKFATYMWEGCGLYPNQAIEELKLRCLIRFGDYGEFEVHDQLRDFGRSIFCRGQSLDKCSGPWDYDYNYNGASRVLRRHETYIDEQFQNLQRRWFHHCVRAASSRGSDELLSEVRWLECLIEGSELSLSTTNLHLPKLSILDLSHSAITEDWEGWSSIMASKQLRVLDLGYCMNLRCTPDLSTFTELKILILGFCQRLKHLHPSIGKLKSLISLNLKGCESLQELPEELGELKELEELIVDDAGITEVPTFIGFLRKLETLSANGCKSLTEIPSSIGNFQNLQHLGISGIPISDLPESIQNLSSLQYLRISQCDKLWSLPELPLGLTFLSLSCMVPRLPQLSSLLHLKELHLHVCHLLEDIPELSPRLLKLCVKDCDKLMLTKLDGFNYLEECSIKKCGSIERLDLSQLIHLRQLHVEHCNSLVEIEGLDNLDFLEDIYIFGCNSIKILVCPESRLLKKLEAIMCNNLVEIRGLASAKFLEELYLAECKSMEILPDLTGCEKLRSLVIKDCKKLAQIRGLEKLDRILLDIQGCDSLETLPK